MKIYVIAAMHGNELFGLKVIGRMLRHKDVRVRVGHPEAVAKHVRFLDEDLNRSFTSGKKTVEARLAQNIKSEIEAFNPDVILDLHTSGSDVGNIAIVAKHCELTDRVSQAMNLEAVVVMPEDLTKKSVLGCFPEKSISLEFGRNSRSDKLAKGVAACIDKLDLDNLPSVKNLPVYEIHNHIDKEFEGLKGIKNLVFNDALDGYPFLAGPNTYEAIGGFLAKKIS